MHFWCWTVNNSHWADWFQNSSDKVHMQFRGQHAHATICHILLNVEVLCLKIHFPGSCVFIQCSALKYSRLDFFTGVIIVKPKGKALHYVGATFHLENDSNATEGIAFLNCGGACIGLPHFCCIATILCNAIKHIVTNKMQYFWCFSQVRLRKSIKADGFNLENLNLPREYSSFKLWKPLSFD